MLANVTSEPFTLMMGFHMNNVAWKIFLESGLVFSPFLVMYLRNFIKVKTSGRDEGPSGDLLLNYIEADLYKMVLVLVFCVIPISSAGTVSSTSFTSYSCSARNLTSGNDLSDVSVIGGVTEKSPNVQMWWWLTHEVSTYITNYMIANVPCAKDTRFAQVAFDASKIEDPKTQVFANEFYKQCFSPAMNHIVKSGNTDNARKDLWIGSEKALSHYGRETSVMTINKDYWLNSGGGSGSLDPVRGGDAYPNCLDAYQHFSAQIDKEVERLNEESWVNDWFRTDASLKEEFMRKTMAGAATRSGGIGSEVRSNSSAFEDVAGRSAIDNSGNIFTDAAVSAGTAAKALSSSVDAVTYRTMAPHAVSAIQMIILISVPILLIFSGLNISTAGVLTGWYFATEFTLVIEELGYWFDNMMTHVITNNPGVFSPGGLGEMNVLMILGNLSYQWFPMVWLALVSVLGLKGVSGSMSGVASSSQGTASSAANTGKMAASGAKGAGGAIGKRLMRK